MFKCRLLTFAVILLILYLCLSKGLTDIYFQILTNEYWKGKHKGNIKLNVCNLGRRLQLKIAPTKKMMMILIMMIMMIKKKLRKA